MLGRAVRRRRLFCGVREPVFQRDAGASGTWNCCCEHGRQTPLREAPPGGPCQSRREGGAMDVLVERCAGLDVHKDTVVACVRTPGPEGRRTQETETFGATTAALLALR